MFVNLYQYLNINCKLFLGRVIFYSAKGRMKGNYYPEIYHFFDLVFLRHAQRNTKPQSN